MTITVKLFIPAGKRAKVTTNGTTTYHDAGDADVLVGYVHDSVDLLVSEVEAEDGGAVASADGGGNGNGPPPNKS